MDTQELARLGNLASDGGVSYSIGLTCFWVYYKNLPLSMHRCLACFLEEVCPLVSAVVEG